MGPSNILCIPCERLRFIGIPLPELKPKLYLSIMLGLVRGKNWYLCQGGEG